MSSIFVCLQDQQYQLKLLKAVEANFGNVLGLPAWEKLSEIFESKQDDPSSWILITDEINETLQKLLKKIRSPCTILLYSKSSFEEVIIWFKQLPLRNLILQTENDHPEFIPLISSLRKILTQDIFGIEKYVTEEVKIIRKSLQNSDERFSVKEEISSFMEPRVSNIKLRRAIPIVLEELIMNAFYNAPVDENRQPLFANQDQKIPVQFPLGKAIEVCYGLDGDHLILSVCDPYGSFQDSFLIESLSRHFEGTLSLREGKGGAGFGLVKLYKSLSHLIVNIEAEKQTEFIAIINFGIRYAQFLKRPRSLNIFVL